MFKNILILTYFLFSIANISNINKMPSFKDNV